MNTKSTSCFSPSTGKPLTEYDSEDEAWEGANYANAQYDNDLVPYQCKTCNLWHLSPRDRQTPNRKCYDCSDSSGNHKALYYSEEDAERRSGILNEEQGIQLKVYKCPHNDGWHLTKKT